jgi:hypothetical protein
LPESERRFLLRIKKKKKKTLRAWNVASVKTPKRERRSGSLAARCCNRVDNPFLVFWIEGTSQVGPLPFAAVQSGREMSVSFSFSSPAQYQRERDS